MKTKKEGLSLNKFTIAKLNNLNVIKGGEGDDNTGTHTDNTVQNSTNLCKTTTTQ